MSLQRLLSWGLVTIENDVINQQILYKSNVFFLAQIEDSIARE